MNPEIGERTRILVGEPLVVAPAFRRRGGTIPENTTTAGIRRRGWSKQQVFANGDEKKQHNDYYNEPD